MTMTDDEDHDDGVRDSGTNGNNSHMSNTQLQQKHHDIRQRLLDLGFEFRFVPCPEHAPQRTSTSNNIDSDVIDKDVTADGDMAFSQQEVPSCSLVETAECDHGCSIRLFHHDEMMTVETYPLNEHIPQGPTFDQVQILCQQEVQNRLCHDFKLHLLTLFDDVNVLVSDSLVREEQNDVDESEQEVDAIDEQPVSLSGLEKQHHTHILTASASTYSQLSVRQRLRRPNRKNTLIVIGGKGISRCGLVSMKQTLGSSIERGSCAYHIKVALERQWHVIVLDPNAQGTRGGFEIITKSLDRLLFMDSRPESISSRVMGMDIDDDDNDDSSSSTNGNMYSSTSGWDVEEGDECAATLRRSSQAQETLPQTSKPGPNLYFFCHSAAGGFIVRYLLDQSVGFLRRIAKLCFSDSTHRLSWADPSKHKYLHDVLLQDPQYALYIRNNNLGRDYPLYKTPMPGDECGETVDHWWIHRYGKLRTVWAGTSDHSLMVFEARKVVWDFFDNKISEHNGNGHDFNRATSSDALEAREKRRKAFFRKSTCHF